MYYLALDMVGPADARHIRRSSEAFRGFKTFKRDAKLSSWLYRIAYNTSIDHLRRKLLAPEPVEDAVLDVADSGFGRSGGPPDPARTAESSLLRAKVEKALQKVSTRERTVFLLHHYNDLMLDEIAETMQISVGSVKSYLFRCLQKLRKELAVTGRPGATEASDERL
jgi:RNA polymerase sigma-70 factor (ECF subfamily)